MNDNYDKDNVVLNKSFDFALEIIAVSYTHLQLVMLMKPGYLN